MAISRRSLLSLAAGGLAWSLLPLRLRAGNGRPLYVSARADAGGRYHVSAFTDAGAAVFDLPLPARGHSFALHPDGRAAVHFGRRPGDFAQVIDLGRGARLAVVRPPARRRFNGHGAFSPDGRLVYATENDFEGELGVVGVYDAADGYRRVGELPSHGIGPHDIRMLGDGDTLAVANGGIHTHPDFPRVKLNVPTMTPSLAYLDRRDGRLIEAVQLLPDLHRLSIRHLAEGRGGVIGVAMQYLGPAGDLVPLVATHRRGEAMRLLEGPEDTIRDMNQYCGSTVFDRSGRVLAVSSPRGNVLTFWEAGTGKLLATARVPDSSGLAPGAAPGTFLASSGRGGVVAVDARSGTAKPIVSDFLAAGRWDNHMLLVER